MKNIPTILMIRPVRFAYNAETAINNAFQNDPEYAHQSDNVQIQERARAEFDGFVEKLRAVDIPVMVVEDSEEPHTPDSIFPNNWITTHSDGTMVLYPMFAENRRLERKDSVIELIHYTFRTGKLIDLTEHEGSDRFLEGTGSFILDRDNKIAYACLSPRTDEGLFRKLCAQLEYKAVVFHAYDDEGTAIYHTNVMMCVADRYAIINLDCIPPEEREMVREELTGSGKKVITITQDQMARFAGNMLQVFSRQGNSYLVMSSQAYHSLDTDQVKAIEEMDKILHSPLDTIESNGGGSARCMMAEVYLEAR
ncbi:MAG TPA: arginine deiminase-related protein [Sphingobacteriaceae bacterium]|nr:arginine deiminase-related protein [Sphingobacteriaceae bacterium]